MDRECEKCQKPLIRRAEETSSNFRKRRFCGRPCACSIGYRLKGQIIPKRKTPCSVCGAVLMRARHFADAICRDCTKARQRKAENAYNQALKADRKKLRILLAALGFESFDATMDYLRTVPWVFVDGELRRELRELERATG